MTKKGGKTTKRPARQVIAVRKACDARGTGLTHYVLLGEKRK